MNDFSVTIKGRTLEYIDSEHIYLIDGVIVPSISQIVRAHFPDKYSGISAAVLHRAAKAGTEVHDAIERYCTQGETSDLPEVRNFRFLQAQYRFTVTRNEVPVVLEYDGAPVAAGRFDMELQMDGQYGGADIKRTAQLDKDYLAYQLNLYRVACRQSYNVDWTFLRGIHLRGSTRRFVQIPINEDVTMAYLKTYLKGERNE